jgi:hypothetical protein
MEYLRRIAKPISHFVIFAFLWLGLQLPAAQAGIVGTEIIVSNAQAQQDRTQIMNLLDRKDIQEQLISHGVNVEQAKTRVDSLSDAETHTLANQLNTLPAGGDSSILGVIVLIFLVLLVTDILGLTNVFPFTKKHR